MKCKQYRPRFELNSLCPLPKKITITPNIDPSRLFHCQVGRVFASGLGDRGSVPGQVIPKTQKWYLMPLCLTLSIVSHGSRVKRSNPGKGVVTSPTHRKEDQRKWKEIQVLRPCLRIKKVVEHESDGDTNCNWGTGKGPKGLGKETGRVGNQRENRQHPN